MNDLDRALAAYEHAIRHNPRSIAGITRAVEHFQRVLSLQLENGDVWSALGHCFLMQDNLQNAYSTYQQALYYLPNPKDSKLWHGIGILYDHYGSLEHAEEAFSSVLHMDKDFDKVDETFFRFCQPGNRHHVDHKESRVGDAQSWYLLGRAYMAGQKYQKAYESYQQAVYRDGRNPTFWCSIGVLYYNINQFRDALDAYSRAIRINPYISEVWFDLGSLYKSCNNQISDVIDAYARAAELNPGNPHITQRLNLLRNVQANGGTLPATPGPKTSIRRRMLAMARSTRCMEATRTLARHLRSLMVLLAPLVALLASRVPLDPTHADLTVCQDPFASFPPSPLARPTVILGPLRSAHLCQSNSTNALAVARATSSHRWT
ncbi:glucose repression mediator protein [Ceratobasidium sp. UAMH 11750]|nr:glucose repression mediator protein [Ceratobasidium sp. UAMH 11750]